MRATRARHRLQQTTMRHTFAVTLVALPLTLLMNAQDDVPTFKTQASSSFVWGKDNGPGAVSSSVRDPLTGNAIHKLNHGGIEVSSRAGFERVGSGQSGELLSFTTTIVNNTESELSVRQGGTSVDGRITLPLPVVLTKKGLSKRERNQVWELASMKCFGSRLHLHEVPTRRSFSSKACALVWCLATSSSNCST